MSAGPQKEDGFTPIANEIVEALCRTNLSPHESRVLWCVFRKTYGWSKKEDWISLSQIVELTGMHKAHVSRAKRKLLERHLVTQTGNQIAFNKHYTQWRELPKRVTVTQTGTPPVQIIDPPPKRVTTPPPVQAHTTETFTKPTLTKESRLVEKPVAIDPGERERRFKALLVQQQWCDQAYADKTWDQGMAMPDRAEFVRKVNLLLGWARIPSKLQKARVLFHEISGFVNDRGAMLRQLSPQEMEARRLFREETGQDIAEA